jgi:hypothetical protein|nr:MAG TPA: hypothetical protein [Caudoviricetes sp.]
MIKFENTEVFNFNGAIRGMRNPLNSWVKSDSNYYDYGAYEIGPKDLDLMKRLIKAGSDHRKFMRQILVSVDITAPLYWWKEFDTYKVGTVSNSCSTMHRIQAKEFTINDFSYDHCEDDSIIENYINTTLWILNGAREQFLQTKDKAFWWQMIQLLPSSYNQKRTITLNYETLYNIYGSRKNHKLDEWSVGFMEWIESLPYAEELIVNRD